MLLKAVLLAALPVLLLWGAVRFAERALVFFPTRQWDIQPAGFAPFEEVVFKSLAGPELSGLWFPAENARGAILYCHGNAGNLSHRIPVADRWRRQFQWSVFLFDYQGYGRSQGRPSEEGLLKDAEAAYLEARRRGGGEPVVAGRSLGTVPAVRLAAAKAARGLILDSPLANARRMARTVLPVPGLGKLISLKLDNLSWIREIRCPLLVVHGERDEIIPLSQGREVFEAAPGASKRLLVLAGAGHNDDRDDPAVTRAMRHFLESLGK